MKEIYIEMEKWEKIFMASEQKVALYCTHAKYGRGLA